MLTPVRRAAVAPLFAITALIVGCGEKLPEFGQVEGVVTVKGRPAADVAVRFLPDPSKGNDLPINANAVTDAAGKYLLAFAYKDKEGPGAPVGWHRVVLEDTRLSSIPQGAKVPPRLFPIEYGNPVATPLSYEVQPGSQTINIEVP